VHSLTGGTGTVLLTSSSQPLVEADAEVVLVKQVAGSAAELGEGRGYDWDVVMRAGRTDPAACVEGAEVTPYDEQVRAWLEPLLAGETLDLTGPVPARPPAPG
jgi:hypothetical protein